MRGFSAGAPGPLDPSAEARLLLESVGIAERRWTEVPYGNLNLASLESVFSL